MKKFLSIIMIMLCFNALKAQDSLNTKNIAITDTSTVSFTTVYKDVKTSLNGLGAALKVGAEHVYEVVVRQQVVNSIVWIIVGIIPMLLLMIFGKSIWIWADNNAQSTDGFSIFCATLFFIPCIISIMIVMFHIDTIVTGIVNPEYGAVQDIMSFIK